MHMSATKKTILVLGGAVGLAIVWWLGSPLLITRRVNEALPVVPESIPAGTSAPSVESVAPVASSASLQVLSEGKFTGFDKLHQASGTARLIRTGGKAYIRFEEDFKTTNGPDLFVYLGNNNEHDPKANLGALKGNEGSQNYEILSSINIEDYSEVWVWCRAFSVPFGKAILSGM